ncbi:unnamed protein product [Schistosoma intercalatum]|nr:unnamed protein product [Schistosoma intercalatum]
MSTFAFDDVLATFIIPFDRFSFQRLEHPIVLSGLILTFIGLLIGLLIILIKKLHSTSIRNSIFMVITLIIMIIGVGLLNSPTKWNWNHSLDCRGGTSQLYCTRCSLDLLVLCNVDCDCRRSILFG